MTYDEVKKLKLSKIIMNTDLKKLAKDSGYFNIKR